MALRYWKRMREEAGRGAPVSHPAGRNPWDEGARPTLSQLGAHLEPDDGDRAARYADWAARLRERSAPASPETAATTSTGYWSAESLFEDSRRLAREEGVSRNNPWVVRELLAVLDLPEGATNEEIGSAYRRLAKQHHPDRYMMADPETRAYHDAEMRRIIDAYEALRRAGASPA